VLRLRLAGIKCCPVDSLLDRSSLATAFRQRGGWWVVVGMVGGWIAKSLWLSRMEGRGVADRQGKRDLDTIAEGLERPSSERVN
jgi:hypothetical protein